MAQNHSGYSLTQGDLVDNQVAALRRPGNVQIGKLQNSLNPPHPSSTNFGKAWRELRTAQQEPAAAANVNAVHQLPLTRILATRQHPIRLGRSTETDQNDHWKEMLRRHRLLDQRVQLNRAHSAQIAIAMAQAILARDPPNSDISKHMHSSCSSTSDGIINEDGPGTHPLVTEKETEHASANMYNDNLADGLQYRCEDAENLNPQLSKHHTDGSVLTDTTLNDCQSAASKQAEERLVELKRQHHVSFKTALEQGIYGSTQRTAASVEPSVEERSDNEVETLDTTSEHSPTSCSINPNMSPTTSSSKTLSPTSSSRTLSLVLAPSEVTTSEHARPSFHDIDFRCSLDSCGRHITDANKETKICNGCGPYSNTRYCNLQHLLVDAEIHFFSCGLETMRSPVNTESLPQRYRSSMPKIMSLHRKDNASRSRQLVYCTRDKSCDYALFMPEGVIKLTWPATTEKPDPTKPLIHRLLNIGFLDYQQTRLITALYHAIRQKTGTLTENSDARSRLIARLDHQFTREFYYRIATPQEGAAMTSAQEVQDWSSLIPVIEDMERRFWILRLWRDGNLGRESLPALGAHWEGIGQKQVDPLVNRFAEPYVRLY